MMHLTDRLPPLNFDGETLVEIQNLGFRYPTGQQALCGVDLKIHRGDRIALLGQNGSGKSTLVRHLNGLLPLQEGHLSYKGLPLTGTHLRRARLEIGLLFQDPDDQLFCNTLSEDVAFGPRNQGYRAGECEALVTEALDAVDLAPMRGKAPHLLSYGQKKRAALATVLAMKPEILILDEPNANLDATQEGLLRELLRHYSGTLICITHDLLFAYDLCQRAVVLDQGRVHHDFTMQELVAHRPSMREHGLDFSFRLDNMAPAAPSQESTTTCLQSPDPGMGKTAFPPDEGPPLVQLEDYWFAYPDGTEALRNINFKLHRGEKVAIVGENGAGKTTLLHCLMGILEGRGKHLLNGRPARRRQKRELWRRVGMVFQDSADQLFCPSCAEEVAFGPRQMGLAKDEISDRVSKALDQVRLKGYESRVPLHLSGGERKRLAIATALSMDPEILILDEPTAGLDPQGEELLLQILQGLPQTRILVAHDPFLIRELTRRTIVMHQGVILQDYATKDFLADQNRKNFNFLALTYKRERTREILELQHRHEHNHAHRHLHDHPHRHGNLEHSHPHEHIHEHFHQYTHTHEVSSEPHNHPPLPRYHEHPHSNHLEEPHDHDHPHSDLNDS